MHVAAQLKSEMVLAVQLAARHRTVRLTALLGLAGLVAARSAHDPLPALLLVACGIGATAASRPLAPGAAFHLARRAAAHPVITATGRLGGVALLLLGATAAALPVAGAGELASVAWRQVAVAVLAGVAVAAPVLALSPVAGASGAGGLGLLIAVLGQVPPSGVHAGLAGWPALRAGAVLAWNVLPMPWRAERWVVGAPGAVTDVAVLVGWILVGVATAAWMLVPPRDARGGAR